MKTYQIFGLILAAVMMALAFMLPMSEQTNAEPQAALMRARVVAVTYDTITVEVDNGHYFSWYDGDTKNVSFNDKYTIIIEDGCVVDAVPVEK